MKRQLPSAFHDKTEAEGNHAMRLERMGLRWHWAVEEKVRGDGYTIVAGGYSITSRTALRAARRAAARHAWAVDRSLGTRPHLEVPADFRGRQGNARHRG